MQWHELASWVPFVAMSAGNDFDGGGNGERRTRAVAVRLAEICLLLAFGAFWLQKIEARIDDLTERVVELQVQVAVNADRSTRETAPPP